MQIQNIRFYDYWRWRTRIFHCHQTKIHLFKSSAPCMIEPPLCTIYYILVSIQIWIPYVPCRERERDVRRAAPSICVHAKHTPKFSIVSYGVQLSLVCQLIVKILLIDGAPYLIFLFCLIWTAIRLFEDLSITD